MSGVSWIRYRVLFENGVEHGLLDGRHIVDPKDWVPVDERVEEEAVAEVAAADGDGGAGEAAGGRQRLRRPRPPDRAGQGCPRSPRGDVDDKDHRP